MQVVLILNALKSNFYKFYRALGNKFSDIIRLDLFGELESLSSKFAAIHRTTHSSIEASRYNKLINCSLLRITMKSSAYF